MRGTLSSVVMVLTVSVGIALNACGDNSGDPSGPNEETQAPVASVRVTPDSATLSALGITRQFSAAARDASGNTISGKTFRWASTDPGVAVVDSLTGLVTAIGNGLTTVEARTEGVAGSARATVVQTVSSVEILTLRDTLVAPGDTVTLSAQAKDSRSNALSGKTFVWSSGDTTVLKVDEDGVVTAVTNGATVVSAVTEGATGMLWMTVHVRPIAVLGTPDTADVGGRIDVSLSLQTDGLQHATGAMAATLEWDPSVLQYHGSAVGEYPYWKVVFSNDDGRLKLIASEPSGVEGNFTVLTLTFAVIGGTRTNTTLEVTLNRLVAAFSFEDFTSGAIGQSRAIAIR